jgi:hypothetical protein
MTEPVETANLQDLLSTDLVELHKIYNNDLASRYDLITNEVEQILTPNDDPALNANVSATILYISRHDEQNKHLIDAFVEQPNPSALADYYSKHEKVVSGHRCGKQEFTHFKEQITELRESTKTTLEPENENGIGRTNL